MTPATGSRCEDKPRALDLFAGAGGFAEGFRQAGFTIDTCIEIDEWACDTLRQNFSHARVLTSDIRDISDNEIRELFPESPDVILGGPPCQGFSVSGPSNKDPKDPRNSLFTEFVRFVSVLEPAAFVMENVPGLLRTKTAAGEYVINVILSCLKQLGYSVTVKLLQACNFGVPQTRERLFIVGLNKAVEADYFPGPTHGEDVNIGMEHGRQMLIPPENAPFKPYVTLWEAISDLPQLQAGEGHEPCQYSMPPQNHYQAVVREGSTGIYNHVAMEHTKRMVERFQHIGFGQSSSDSPEAFAPRARNSHLISSNRYDQNNRRMYPDRPCHTIPASFYANFIHPFCDRNFTAREGARIQSFPDRFIFKGKPTVVSDKLLAREGRHSERHLCQYNQIGNAVPPLVARAIATRLLEIVDFEVSAHVSSWREHKAKARA